MLTLVKVLQNIGRKRNYGEHTMDRPANRKDWSNQADLLRNYYSRWDWWQPWWCRWWFFFGPFWKRLFVFSCSNYGISFVYHSWTNTKIGKTFVIYWYIDSWRQSVSYHFTNFQGQTKQNCFFLPKLFCWIKLKISLLTSEQFWQRKRKRRNYRR